MLITTRMKCLRDEYHHPIKEPNTFEQNADTIMIMMSNGHLHPLVNIFEENRRQKNAQRKSNDMQ
jgi:hypothetical protein